MLPSYFKTPPFSFPGSGSPSLKLHLLVSPAVGRPLYMYILSYLILTLQFFYKNYSINLQSLQYSRSFLYSNVSSLFIKTIPVLSVHLIISSVTGIKVINGSASSSIYKYFSSCFSSKRKSQHLFIILFGNLFINLRFRNFIACFFIFLLLSKHHLI